MHIGEPRPIRKPIPLTPLVDIVFLLLMFFMLSSTFNKFGTLDANATAARASNDDVPVSGRQQFPGAIVMIGRAGAMTVNGSRIAAVDLAATLDTLHESGVTLVAMRVDKSATVQDLVTALDFARRSHVPDIVVVP
jgi:biopolymer transport protein ExbD